MSRLFNVLDVMVKDIETVACYIEELGGGHKRTPLRYLLEEVAA